MGIFLSFFDRRTKRLAAKEGDKLAALSAYLKNANSAKVGAHSVIPNLWGKTTLQSTIKSKGRFSFQLIGESPSHFWWVPPVIYPGDALQTTRANGVD